MPKRERDLIDEIHDRRRELMAQFGNDLGRYADYLRERERRHPERVVNQIKIVRRDDGARSE